MTRLMTFPPCRRVATVGLLTLAATFAVSASAETPIYRIESAFTHLGELVASPVIVVEEGETARVFRGSDAEAHYTVAVRVTPATDESVNVSLSYDSGVLSAQPNRLVPLGQPYRFTEGSVAIELRVDRVQATGEGSPGVPDAVPAKS